MKKQTKSEKIRRAMVIAVASMMVMGMPMVVNAEEEQSENHEEKSNENHESTSETHSASEKASAAASESKKAESSAQSSSTEAKSKSDDAKESAESAKEEAEKVNNNEDNKKSDIKDAADSAEKAIEDAVEKVSQKSSDSAEATTVEDNTDEEHTIVAAEEETETEVKESVDAAEKSKKEVESLCKDIEDNYNLLFSDDETITKEKRDEAASEIQSKVAELKDNLDTAKEGEATAKDNLDIAEAKLAAAKNNYDVNAILYHQATLGEWDEASQSFGVGDTYGSAEEAKVALHNMMDGAEIPNEWIALIDANYASNQENDIVETIKNAETEINVAEGIINKALGEYNDAKTDYEEAVAAADAAAEAATAAAYRAKEMYDIAEDAAKVVTDKGSESEQDNIYATQIKTAEAVIASRTAAEEAVKAVNEAEAEREAVKDALDLDVKKSLKQLNDAKERLAELKENTTAYRTPLAFEKMVLEITKAQKAVAEAQSEYQNALVNKAKYEKYAEYASYYSYEGAEHWKNNYISDRNISVYVQKDSSGKWATLNDGFDYDDEHVYSKPTKNFDRISEDLKSIDVPDSIYRIYLKALADGNLNLTAGTGIATGQNLVENSVDRTKMGQASMPVIYWEIKDNQLTGRYYSDITYQPSGEYFVGYVFKRESNMSKEGYHIDGVVIDHHKTPRPNGDPLYVSDNWDPEPKTPETPGTPSNPDTNPGGGNGGNGGNGGGNPGTTTPVVTITNDPVSLADMIDQAAIEILDGPVALAASVPGDVIIDDEGVPLADSIPQTGDNAVSVLPVMLSGIAAIGAALGLGKKKEEK